MADEATSFFNKIKMLPGWKYVGRNNFEGSTGAVVQVAPDTWLRIFYLTDSGKGGIVEKQFDPIKRAYKLRCLIHNKTAQQLNEFIISHYERKPNTANTEANRSL